jgi:lipopolysaccharide/colanic/teichoic acid biosynthesis glycosyltransferase
MLKRGFDFIASLMGLIILSPLLLGLIIIIRLSSQGPIFYRATRVGQHGKQFKLLKFRSMVVNADKIGPAVTGAEDPRITPIGRFLRRTKLDELPQLLNVLLGEMSLVGPRPEDPHYVEMYSEDQRKVLSVRPGLTSLASIEYRHEEVLLTGSEWEEHYIKVIMPSKLAIDLEYTKQATLYRDLVVIFETLKTVLFS